MRGRRIHDIFIRKSIFLDCCISNNGISLLTSATPPCVQILTHFYETFDILEPNCVQSPKSRRFTPGLVRPCEYSLSCLHCPWSHRLCARQYQRKSHFLQPRTPVYCTRTTTQVYWKHSALNCSRICSTSISRRLHPSTIVQ